MDWQLIVVLIYFIYALFANVAQAGHTIVVTNRVLVTVVFFCLANSGLILWSALT